VAARRELLHDPVLWRAHIVFGAHDLFGRGYVVGGTPQKIKRTGNGLEIERSAKTDESARGLGIIFDALIKKAESALGMAEAII
jgi:hypothetical protein